MLPRIKGAMNNQKNFPVTVAFSLAWTLSQPVKVCEPLEGVTGMLWPLDPPPLKMSLKEYPPILNSSGFPHIKTEA